MGLTPGSGRSLGGGNGNSLQYSCLGNPRDRRAWWATVHGVTKSRTWLRKHTHTHTHTHTFSLSIPLLMDVLGFLVMSRGGLFFLFRAAVVCVESENESRSVASDSLQPQRRYSARNSPGQNTGVGSLSLLQGIFPAQGSNPGLPHCRQILYQLSHKGSPRILEWVAFPFSSGSSWPRNRTGVSCIAGRFFTNWAIREAGFVKWGQITLITGTLHVASADGIRQQNT